VPGVEEETFQVVQCPVPGVLVAIKRPHIELQAWAGLVVGAVADVEVPDALVVAEGDVELDPRMIKTATMMGSLTWMH
jgi:hypothetical protein